MPKDFNAVYSFHDIDNSLDSENKENINLYFLILFRQWANKTNPWYTVIWSIIEK